MKMFPPPGKFIIQWEKSHSKYSQSVNCGLKMNGFREKWKDKETGRAGGGAVFIRKGKSDARFEGVEGINFGGKRIPSTEPSWCRRLKGE